jgi:hypothetical protein
VADTLKLRAGSGGERISETMKLQFVDRAGRYILQQLHKIKGRHGTKEEWRDVTLQKDNK